MGRRSTFTQAVADEICERLSNGEPLQWICASAGMPPVRTVNKWTEDRPEFLADFARARARGFDAIAADTLLIADTPLEGEETVEKPDGSVEKKRGDMLGHRKLQIETRLKLLAKWDPKRYGDKYAVGGADDLPPIQSNGTLTLAPEEAYKRMLGGG